MRQILIGSFAILALFAISCDKEETPEPAPEKTADTSTVDTTKKEPEIDYPKLIQKYWDIVEATGNGNPDPATTGKTLDFMDKGKYNFSGSFQGTWEYKKEDHTIFMDAGTQYENTWNIETITETELIVTFPSPWDGLKTPLRWVMKPI